MNRALFTGLTLALFMMIFSANAETNSTSNAIEIEPSDYGKFGLVPFVGPVSPEGTQETTLVFNKVMHGRDVSKVELLFFSSIKNLILSNEINYVCEKSKCFITFGIIPDYQYNLEFEFVYGDVSSQVAETKAVRYRIKDMGMLTGRFNRTH